MPISPTSSQSLSEYALAQTKVPQKKRKTSYTHNPYDGKYTHVRGNNKNAKKHEQENQEQQQEREQTQVQVQHLDSFSMTPMTVSATSAASSNYSPNNYFTCPASPSGASGSTPSSSSVLVMTPEHFNSNTQPVFANYQEQHYQYSQVQVPALPFPGSSSSRSISSNYSAASGSSSNYLVGGDFVPLPCRSAENRDKLMSHLKKACNFNLHHNAIAEYALAVPYFDSKMLWEGNVNGQIIAPLVDDNVYIQEPTVEVFVGSAAPNTPNILIQYMFKMFANVDVLRIKFRENKKVREDNSNKHKLALCAFVTVRASDADKAIAGIHKRVLFDEALCYYGHNQQAIEVLNAYCAMMKANEGVRYHNRPYQLVTCQRRQPQHQQRNNSNNQGGQQRQEEDQYHPLCCCATSACRSFRMKHSDYSFLQRFLHEFAHDINLRQLMPLHSTRSVNTPAEWCPVSTNFLRDCQHNSAACWDEQASHWLGVEFKCKNWNCYRY